MYAEWNSFMTNVCTSLTKKCGLRHTNGFVLIVLVSKTTSWVIHLKPQHHSIFNTQWALTSSWVSLQVRLASQLCFQETQMMTNFNWARVLWAYLLHQMDWPLYLDFHHWEILSYRRQGSLSIDSRNLRTHLNKLNQTRPSQIKASKKKKRKRNLSHQAKIDAAETTSLSDF